MHEKATTEGLAVRIVAYSLGGKGHCADGVPKVWAKFGIEHRDFDFSKYPPHVANLHCYAWKPPIIDEVLKESSNGTVVMWVDSGATVMMRLKSIIDITKRNGGFLSDETSKGVVRFAHEKQVDYGVQAWGLDATFAATVKELRSQGEGYLDNNDRLGLPWSKFRNCNGAFSAHIKGSARYDAITRPWVACALDKKCVCPEGSNRGNARQDQSALTLSKATTSAGATARPSRRTGCGTCAGSCGRWAWTGRRGGNGSCSAPVLYTEVYLIVFLAD